MADRGSTHAACTNFPDRGGRFDEREGPSTDIPVPTPLVGEAGNATIKDVEKEITEDVRQLWKGGPAGRLAEIGELAAAVTALLNFTIFEHPKLFKFLTDAQAGGRSVGMD